MFYSTTDLSVVKLSIDIDLSLGDVTGQVRNGMCYIWYTVFSFHNDQHILQHTVNGLSANTNPDQHL